MKEEFCIALTLTWEDPNRNLRDCNFCGNEFSVGDGPYCVVAIGTRDHICDDCAASLTPNIHDAAHLLNDVAAMLRRREARFNARAERLASPVQRVVKSASEALSGTAVTA